MADLTIFGLSLNDYITLVLVVAPIGGILMATFAALGALCWKGLAEELDRLAGPVDDLSEGSPWEILKRSIRSAWRRDLWLPLAVFRALRRRRKG